jgi:hypothetical protein
MTEILAVRRATADQLCCHCGHTIVRGRRTALLAGIGAVHLACVIARYDTEETNAAVTRPAQQPEPPAAVVGDVGEETLWEGADWPAAARPEPRPVADDDDRDLPWWQR